MESQPQLTFNSAPDCPGFGSVVVNNLDPALIELLESSVQSAHRLQSILRVAVIQDESLEDESLPDVCGHYQFGDEGVRFIPYFPFEPGVPYRATFDPRSIYRKNSSKVLKLTFSLPETRSRSGLPSEVMHIYPTSDHLPENLLRFYVHFSESMQRGLVEDQISLLGPDGATVPDVLYRPPVELWDRNMRCLTILLDPGRLKRGVGPYRKLGPPLKAGLDYTLAVGSGMINMSGRPLAETVYKRFRVTEAVRTHVALEQWKLIPPATESREPLVLLFPRPLDRALLVQNIKVVSTDGQRVSGQVAIDECEQRWSFTPASAWAGGSYAVRIKPSLEDICGNSVIAPFDRAINGESDVSMDFVNRTLLFNPLLQPVVKP